MFRITPPESQSDKNLTTSRPRIAWLDSLKGFAIICVVVGHVVGGGPKANFTEDIFIARFIYNAIYAFHMPLFFVVSGFMYSMAYFDSEGRPKWAKLKWQLPNIVVLYFLFTTLLVAFRILFGQHSESGTRWSDLLGILAHPYPIYWYLYDLAVFYILFIPLLRFAKSYLLLPLFFALRVFAADIPQIEGYDAQFMLFLNVPFFFLGIIFQRTKVSISWWVALAGLGTYVCLSMVGDGVLNYAKAFGALGLCLFFWKLFSSVKWLNAPFLNLCGRYSLEIYVLHFFPVCAFRSFFLPALGITSFWSVFILNSALSTAIPILIAVALQRVGIHDAVFRPAYFVKSRIEARAKP